MLTLTHVTSVRIGDPETKEFPTGMHYAERRILVGTRDGTFEIVLHSDIGEGRSWAGDGPRTADDALASLAVRKL
jgi:hypothetical protein